MSDVAADQDFEIRVREQTRGSKLEAAYKKRRAKSLQKPPHTHNARTRQVSADTAQQT